MKFISNGRRFWIVCVYIIGLCIWFLLSASLRLYSGKSAVVLWLVPIVFLINIYNANCINAEVEAQTAGTSFLEVGLIISISILGWMRDVDGFDHNLVYIMLLGMVFALLGRIDLWIPIKWWSVYKHVRSVFQTFTITIFIYVLLEFFFSGINIRQVHS